MPWLQTIYVPLIAIGVGFHFGVTWVLLSRHVQKPAAGDFWWLVGWILLTGHVLAMLLAQVWNHAPIIAVQHLTYLAAAYAFFAGQAGSPRPDSPLARSVLAGTAVAAILALIAVWPPPAGSIPLADATRSILAGGALPVSLAAAWSFLAATWLAYSRRETPVDIATALLLGGFAFGSLHALDYSLLTDAWWKTPLEIFESALFSLVFATAVTLRSWAQAREVRILHRVAESLNRPRDGQETLETALDVVLSEFNLSQGWALVRREGRGGSGGRWFRTAARGFPEWATRSLGDAAFPLRACRCLQPLGEDQLTWSVNVVDCAVAVRLTGRPGAGRHVTLPLGSAGTLSGLLTLVLPEGRRLNAGEIQLLRATGEQIGLALDRARLYDEAREREAARGELLARLLSAQEEERGRIARGLHDEVGQALTAIIVGLDMAARVPGTDAETMRERLGEVKGIAENSLQEIRRVIQDLRPTVLDDLGLEEALRWLVSRYLERAGLEVNLEVSGLRRGLPRHVETAIFRMVQEAGTNAIKHAHARRLRIWVRRLPSGVNIGVVDDGRGLPPAEARNQHGGLGLDGLRERVTLLGGHLRIQSRPGRGTRLAAIIPLPEEEEAGPLTKPAGVSGGQR